MVKILKEVFFNMFGLSDNIWIVYKFFRKLV